jgi:hypothetical protein
MREIIVVIFCLFYLASAFNQQKDHIGQLRLKEQNYKKGYSAEDICGISTPVIRVTVTAKTRCQLSCILGDPSKNIYRTVTNKLIVSYGYDSIDKLYKVILKEIELKNTIWNTIVRYSVQKKSERQTILPYSDTLKIQLDAGFINDVLKIKSGNNYFVTDTLNSDKLLGHAATLKIPKTKGRQRLMIYLNEVYIGKLTLRKEFSEAHINYFDNEFEWTYMYYRFFYL